MNTRRGFLGGLLGLLGISSTVVANKNEEPAAYKRLCQAMRSQVPGGWSYDYYVYIIKQLNNRVPDMMKKKSPNRGQTWDDFICSVGDQIEHTGSGLIWMVCDKSNNHNELYGIPTIIAVPHPATYPYYPHGYYLIKPIYPLYAKFKKYDGTIMAAQNVLRIKSPPSRII